MHLRLSIEVSIHIAIHAQQICPDSPDLSRYEKLASLVRPDYLRLVLCSNVFGT